MDLWIVAERRIQEAIDEGQFDNLPGKGQPLKLDDAPAHIRLLRNAGVLPDWAQLDKDIHAQQDDCAQVWRRTEREYARRRARAMAPTAAGTDLEDFAAWRLRAREAYVAELRRVNHQILRLNMLAPAVVREIFPFRLAEEAARFDSAMPPLSR